MFKFKMLIYSMILMLAFGISCATGKVGTKKLTKENISKVVEGQTTKTELFNLLGRPEQITQTDEKGAGDALYRMTMIKTSVPQGKYEVWNYKVVITKELMIVPGKENLERSGLFIINDKDVVVKKIIEEKSSKGF